MRRRALARIFDAAPPAWLRKAETTVLMRTFARAFGVEAPGLHAFTADEALRAFREFTAACMEEAARDGELAARLRARLGEEAEALGTRIRRLLSLHPDEVLDAARFFYRGIAIGLSGEIPGELRFGPCFFSRRYSPVDCWFMSAFDEGFTKGVSGLKDARLVFSCRLTEGSPCCKAGFGTGPAERASAAGRPVWDGRTGGTR